MSAPENRKKATQGRKIPSLAPKTPMTTPISPEIPLFEIFAPLLDAAGS